MPLCSTNYVNKINYFPSFYKTVEELYKIIGLFPELYIVNIYIFFKGIMKDIHDPELQDMGGILSFLFSYQSNQGGISIHWINVPGKNIMTGTTFLFINLKTEMILGKFSETSKSHFLQIEQRIYNP